MNYRLYTFVASLYLSPLQCGLQTAHVVGELATAYPSALLAKNENRKAAHAFYDWAKIDKTIIICGAGTHGEVLGCYEELKRTGTSALCLPSAIFHEDEDSMNSMATACGVVVPQKYWDVKFDVDSQCYEYIDEQLMVTKYPLTHPEGQFIQAIKSYRLA